MKIPRGIVLTLLLGVVLTARLGVTAWVAQVHPAGLEAPDTHTYVNTARAVLAHGRLAVAPELPDEPQTVRTAGYPLFLAVVYRLAGERPGAAAGAQAALSVLSVLLVYALARRAWDERSGLAAAGVMALDPLSLFHAPMLLTETLFTILLLAALLAAMRMLGSERAVRFAWAALAGVLLAAATHVRPVSYYLSAPLAIAAGIALWRNAGRGQRRAWLAAVVFLVAFACVVVPWQWRNREAGAGWTFSRIETINLLLYRAAGVEALATGVTLEEAQARLLDRVESREGADWVSVDRTRRAEAVRVLKEHPVLMLRTQAEGAARLLLGPGGGHLRALLGPDVSGSAIVALIGWSGAWLAGVYGLIALGGWKGWYGLRKRWAVHLPVLVTLVYLVVVSAGPEANSRFRVPVAPLLALYAGRSLVEFGRCCRRRES